MKRPLMLDLFCGGGGAGMGYHRAGFDVIGIDINPQPNYPFMFMRRDVQDVLAQFGRFIEFELGGEEPAAVHASPPCQHYSAMSNCRPGLAGQYPDLVAETRDGLNDSDLPWVMENVVGAGLPGQDTLDGSHGVTLCGHMFGLRLYRHRLFESNVPLSAPPHPRHLTPASKAGHWVPGTIISISSGGPGTEEKKRAMGIDWMNRDELTEAIPPAYTEHIGAQLIQALEVAA